MTAIISEALMRMWQAQGVMAPSPIPDVPARYYVPPQIYPPQPPARHGVGQPPLAVREPTAWVPPPGTVPGPSARSRELPPAVIPNPADRIQQELVREGPWRGYKRQMISKPEVPPWNL